MRKIFTTELDINKDHKFLNVHKFKSNIEMHHLLIAILKFLLHFLYANKNVIIN